MVYLDEFPEARPHTVFTHGFHEAVGSSGAGKAMNLSRLGVDVTLWALVGDDDAGRRIRREMQRRGVEFVGVTDPAGTTRHINLMDREGERISIFANAGSDRFGVDVSSMAPSAAGADLSSVTIANHCRPFLPMLLEMGKPIWVDLHDYDGVNPHHDEFLEAADHLSDEFGCDARMAPVSPRPGCRRTRVAICTHGASGASGLTAEEGWVDIPAMPVLDVVDTNGAGDAFFAGFAVEWHLESGLAPPCGPAQWPPRQSSRRTWLHPLFLPEQWEWASHCHADGNGASVLTSPLQG